MRYIYLILLMFLANVTYGIDAKEARKISDENVNLQAKRCAKQIIKDLNDYIPKVASRGGYATCTMPDDCDYDNYFLETAHDYFTLKGYLVYHREESLICVDWSRK